MREEPEDPEFRWNIITLSPPYLRENRIDTSLQQNLESMSGGPFTGLSEYDIAIRLTVP